MAIIKFAIRRNLIYPLQLIIWNLVRNLLTMFIKYLFDFSDSLVYSPLMFLGELIGGGIIYIYQKKYLLAKKNEENEQYFMSIKLLSTKEDEDDYFIPVDGNIKILFLMFLIAFCDHEEFLVETTIIPKFNRLSSSIVLRLGGFSALFTLLFYLYALKLPIYKHHKLSLTIIAICLILIIICEYHYQEINFFFTYKEFTEILAIIIVSQLLKSELDSIEKYLFEFDYMNPFFVLSYEGLFGFLITFSFCAIPEYLDDVKEVYKEKSIGMFILFIFLLFVYVVLSAGRNIFRIVTNKIYSPMASSLTDYFLNPIYLLYYFGALKDFVSDEKLNVPYFIINIFLSLIISFFGCVYSEFIILSFCGLERETHYQITKRSILNVNTELLKLESDEYSHNSDDYTSSK